jgi:hypothetical protein
MNIPESFPLMKELLITNEGKENPKDQINIRLSLLQRVLEAIDAFEGKRLSCFDAIVGDQACQIRALRICLLSREDLEGEFRKAKLLCQEKCKQSEKIRENIDKLQFEASKEKKEELKQLVEMSKKVATNQAEALEAAKGKSKEILDVIKEAFFKEFAEIKKKKAILEGQIKKREEDAIVKQHELLKPLDTDFDVDERILFIARAYFLTLIKKAEVLQKNNLGEVNYKDKTKVANLYCGPGKPPTTLLEEVVKVAKNEMAAMSFRFVQAQASRLTCAGVSLLQTRVSKPRQTNGRQELPFYYMTKVIFERALEERLYVLVKVRNKASNPLEQSSFLAKRLFVGNPETHSFERVDATGIDRTVDLLVIEAISDNKLEDARFLDTLVDKGGGLMGVIDLNAVQHTQYSDQNNGPKFDEIPDIPPEERKALCLKVQEAVEKGFAKGYSQALLIDHVFAENINLKILG